MQDKPKAQQGAAEPKKRSRGRTTEERLSREDWIDAAWNLLSIGSIETIKVDKLAGQLNVTRGSFYWHFKNRTELLEAVVDRWLGNLGFQKVIVPLMSTPAPPEERLWKVFEYVVRNIKGPQSLVLRIWAQRSRKVASRLASEDEARISHYESLFNELGFSPDEAMTRAEAYYAVVMSEYIRHANLTMAQRLSLARKQHDFLISKLE
mgnify:CR=1 FL=1